MKIYIPTLVIALLIAGVACQKKNVGFLDVAQASYAIDSMVVKLKLDTTPPTEVPNPTYYSLLNQGWSASTLLSFGIFPTIKQNAGVDYDRNRLNIPWSSTAIEGVTGTMPIKVVISKVTTDKGDADKLKQVASIRSNGIISIPLNNGLPAGYYHVSLAFSNEGYTKSLDNIFTVIVK